MKYTKAIALMLLMASCNSSTTTEYNNNDTFKDYTTKSNPSESVTSCYESIKGKDTVVLNLFSESKIITGSLNYNYYEKDKNKGSFRGDMFGDTLIADYIFVSEGKTSERQVAFLKQGNNFIEGYGDVEEQNGKMIFKDRNALSFTGLPLHKVDCNGQ